MWRMALIFALSFLYHSSSASKCRALSLEGGGSHGAYEVGVLSELIDSLASEEVKWNVVTGISIGATNAGGVAQFAMGEESEMIDFLEGVWKKLRNYKLFNNWTGGIAEGLFFKKGIYNNDPGIQTIHENFYRPFARNITVGAVDVESGTFLTFSDLPYEDMISAITASGSPPVFFPPTTLYNRTLVDGGTLINMDGYSAINRCLEVVSSQKDIEIDLIFDMTVYDLDKDIEDLNTFGVLSRVDKIGKYKKEMRYYYNAIMAYPDVNFRYVIHPSGEMPGGIVPLEFKETVIDDEIEMGKMDAKKVLEEKKIGRDTIKEQYQRSQDKIRYVF